MAEDKQHLERVPLWLLWCSAAVVFSVLYLFTAQQGVSWQDSGMFQWRILTGDYRGNHGLALAHPLYIALGRLFLLLPGSSPTFKINSASGVAMALALANILAIASILSGRKLIGIATAAMLSVSHTAWWLATIAEVYTIQLAFFTAELLTLIFFLKKPCCLRAVFLFFLSGLDLSVHNLALLPLPVYLTTTAIVLGKKYLFGASSLLIPLAYGAGASPFLGMIIQDIATSGEVSQTLSSALFGTSYFRAVFNTNLSGDYLLINGGFILLNFANIILPCAVVGWFGLKKNLGTILANACAAITLVEFLFVARYPVPDQFTFFLPTLTMFGIAAALGIGKLLQKSIPWQRLIVAGCMISVILPPLVYAYLPEVVRSHVNAVRRLRELPFRDEARYWIVPWKHDEHSAELFAYTALREAGPDSIIVCDGTSLYPLKLIQMLEHISPEVRLYTTYEIKPKLQAFDPITIDAVKAGKVVLISPALDVLPQNFKERIFFQRKPGGTLYQMVWHHDRG